MGTVSKRPLSEFGGDIKERIDEVRSSVGNRLDDIRQQVNLKGVARGIERVPKTTWLVCAGAALLGSVTLKILGRNHASLLVGQWVPTFLVLGLYARRAIA